MAGQPALTYPSLKGARPIFLSNQIWCVPTEYSGIPEASGASVLGSSPSEHEEM